MAAVSELVERLGVVGELDAAVGPIKVRDRGFGAGQLLSAMKFFIVMPDGIGHGKSSKPSDGMHAKFPHYGYVDMVEAQYRLLTDGLGVTHG